MHELINDPIDVIASFHGSRVVPRRMRWNGRAYNIQKVHLIHSTQEGATRVFYFSVSDADHAFKLRFDTEKLEWKLAEVYMNG